MTVLDVFKGDGYSLASMTAAINKLPHVPNRLERLNLFRAKPITTTIAQVELKQGRLSLVSTSPRGTRGSTNVTPKRNLRTFKVPHLQQNDELLAEDLQGVRAFGKETETEVLNDTVNDKLEAMKSNLLVTKEYHRIGAVHGVLLDADGATEIYDFFDEFGIVEETQNFDFTDSGSMAIPCMAVKRHIETALGASVSTGVHCLAGDTWFDRFVAHESVQRAYERWQEGEFLRGDQREGFKIFGITFENYRGKIADVDFIDPTKARFFPTGTTDVFDSIYAPADYVETVNTRGKPYYAKQWRMPNDKGIEMEAQSNVLTICNNPSVLVEGTGTYI